MLVLTLDDKDVQLIISLTGRLEHLSADSVYAHRASGLRGSLLRYLERLEKGEPIDAIDQARLDQLVKDGFEILVLAAKEIGAK